MAKQKPKTAKPSEKPPAGPASTPRYVAPAQGLRVAGKTYRPGEAIPAKYGRQLAQGQVAQDPAQSVDGVPPNFGRLVMPQVFTFSGRNSTFSNVYRNPDAAVRDSLENSRFMRNDCGVMECLEARQRATALLNWHLEPDDKKDPKQVKLCDDLTKLIQAIPNFTEYRRNLLEALWYGRYAVQHGYGYLHRAGERFITVTQWEPINGDKLVFRYDDGSNKFKPGQVGIRVTPVFSMGDTIAGNRTLEPTESGMAYFLEDWERSRIAIHKHIIEDGVFEDPISAGRIHGVGIRDRIYWSWYQKQETMAHLMEVIERTGSGFTIYWYPAGDDAAKQEVTAQAEAANRSNILIMPRMPGDAAMEAYGIDRIEPNTAGIDAMKGIIDEFFGYQIKRYIIGQTLSSVASATGIGSGASDFQQDTFAQIVQYDAVKLEETLTVDLVEQIKRFNFPWAFDIPVKFKIDTQNSESQMKMQAYKSAWDMGCSLKASDVMDIIGASMPTGEDLVLVNPQIVQQHRLWNKQQQGGMGGDAGMGGDGSGVGGSEGIASDPTGGMMTAAEMFGDALNGDGGEDGQGEGGNVSQGGESGNPSKKNDPSVGQAVAKYARQDEIRVADERIRSHLLPISKKQNKTTITLGRVLDFWPHAKDLSAKAANAPIVFDPSYRGIVYCHSSRIAVGQGAIQELNNRARELGERIIWAANLLCENFGGVAKYQRLTYAEITKIAEQTAIPSEAQKEAGNYSKGKFSWNGLPITIENAAGTKRNEKWKPLADHYGYFNRTEGKDGDHVDVFIGPNTDSDLVVVVDQVSESGKFDEHKTLIGFASKQDAIESYLSNYTSGWKLGEVTSLTVDQFKNWLEDGDTKKPLAKQVSRYKKDSPGQKSLFDDNSAGQQTGGLGLKWDEHKHPRDNSGEFASGAGGGNGNGGESGESDSPTLADNPPDSTPDLTPEITPETPSAPPAAPETPPSPAAPVTPPGKSAKPNTDPANGMLSQDEERDLAHKSKTGDVSAQHKLLTAFLPLVKSKARQMTKGNRDSYDDLVQIGSLGLMNALQSYDPEKSRFSTYATPAIWQSMHKHSMKNYKNWEHEGSQEGEEADLGSGAIADDSAKESSDVASGKEDVNWLKKSMASLPERWQEVLHHRMDGKTHDEIAGALGVSMQRSQQIEQQAMAKLREMHPDAKKKAAIERYCAVGVRLRYAADSMGSFGSAGSTGGAGSAGAANKQPKHHVGETMSMNGKTYRLNENHRWELADGEHPAGDSSGGSGGKADDKAKGTNPHDKHPPESNANAKAFAAKQLASGAVSHPTLAAAIGAFHGKSGGKGIKGEEVRSVLQQALQSGGEGKGPMVDLGNGQQTQAIKAHGGLVVDLGQGRIGFASTAGAIVIHRSVKGKDGSGQAKMTYAANTGIVQKAMGGGEGQQDGAVSPENDPEGDQPGVDNAAAMQQPAQPVQPQTMAEASQIPQSAVSEAMGHNEGQGMDGPASDPTLADNPPEVAPGVAEAAPRPTPELTPEPAPEPPQPAHIALRQAANFAQNDYDRHLENFAKATEAGKLTAKESQQFKVLENAHKTLVKGARMRAEMAEQDHARETAKVAKEAAEQAKSVQQKTKELTPKKAAGVMQAITGEKPAAQPRPPKAPKPDLSPAEQQQRSRERLAANLGKHLASHGFTDSEENRAAILKHMDTYSDPTSEGYIRNRRQLRKVLKRASKIHVKAGGLPEYQTPSLAKSLKSKGRRKPGVNVESVHKANAAAWGLPADKYKEMAKDAWDAKGAGRLQAKEDAKKHLRGLLGMNAGDVSRVENKGGDYAGKGMNGKQLDVWADEVARQYPDLGWQVGDRENEAKAWNLLGEGDTPLPGPTSDEYHDVVHSHLSEILGDQDAHREYVTSGRKAADEADLAEMAAAGAGSGGGEEWADQFKKVGERLRYHATCERHLAILLQYRKGDTGSGSGPGPNLTKQPTP